MAYITHPCGTVEETVTARELLHSWEFHNNPERIALRQAAEQAALEQHLKWQSGTTPKTTTTDK